MTPYERKNFLKEYLKFRKGILRILDGKKITSKKIEPTFSLLTMFGSDYKSEFQKKKINTNNLLATILSKINKDDKIINEIIDKFLKKFEIKKRIFSYYGKDLKEITDDYQNLRNYILLCSICLLKYEKTYNLKYLNASLKLNDSLCSQLTNITEPIDISIFIFNLNREIECVQKLSTQKGLSIK